MNESYKEKVIDLFGSFFEPELLDEIMRIGRFRKIREGELLMDRGGTLDAMPLVLSGSVKVMQENAQGQEILLYYLESGDNCIMAKTCCLNSRKSKIRAIAESDCEVVHIPASELESWLCRFTSWRKYFLDSVEIRMNEFLDSIDSIAFMRMDERLMKYLKDKVFVTGDTELKVTHQEIADDLNTSRVVVSRLLKRLENENKIKLGRNKIEFTSIND